MLFDAIFFETILFQAIFLLLQKTVYFLDQGMKFFGVLLNGSLGTELHPAFFLLVLHACGLQTFKR